MSIAVRTFLVLSWALSSSAILAQTSASKLEQEVTFHIAAQSLDAALLEFSKQANVQVMVVGGQTKDTQAPAVDGMLKAGKALETLLKDSGFEYTAIADGTVTVKRREIAQVDYGQPLVLAQAAGEQPTTGGEKQGPEAIQKEEGSQLEEIVVTGTHIRGVRPTGSPLAIYGRQEIERSGVGTVEQFMQRVPQNFAAVNASTFAVNGPSTQTGQNPSLASGVNLRGLGPSATLVLVNGHRLAPSGTDGGFVDISTLPLSAIERVEILTDGASATYGADAVAGVVNFVLRKDFKGAETTLRYGDTTEGGASETAVAQILGSSWGTGNAMAVYEYHGSKPIRADQRSYIPVDPLNGIGGSFLILPKQTRHSALLTARQAISSRVTAFTDLMYSDRDYEQDQEVFGGLTHAAGDAQQYGAVLGASYDFAPNWLLELVGNYSQMRERSKSTSTFLPGLTDTGGRKSAVASLDLSIEGRAFTLPAGDARVSLGAGFRREKFDTNATLFTPPIVGLQRDMSSLYGEVLLPLIGTANARPGVQSLELSLSARFDDYEKFGSSTNPKVGVSWMPVPSFEIRGTYGTSFKAPTVYQQLNDLRGYFLEAVEDPSALDLATNTLFIIGAGNSALGPEEARSTTAGFDWRPLGLPGFSLSATYFDIEFTDRISTPPFTGITSTVYTDPTSAAVLAPFVDRSPDPAEIDRAFTQGPLQNLEDIDAGSVEATLDLRLHNIAVTKTSGLEFSASYSFATAAGEFRPFVAGDKLFKLSFRPTATTPTLDTVDTIFNPVDLRLRGGIAWTCGGFDSAVTLNYTDAYRNNIETPAGRVKAWTTADLQLSYRTGSRFRSPILQDMTVALSVLNLTNEDPPFVANPSLGIFPDLRFDPTNASPVGRFIAAQIGRRW